jgi:hypothetical protein
MTKLPPWLSAGEAIGWIAFGKATPAAEWADLPELQETRPWRAPRDLLLAALQARAARQEWHAPPGEWWTTEDVLAEIARLERKTERPPAALAEELRADIARIAAAEARIEQAKNDLRDRLADGLIAAQGRRVMARGEQQDHEEIPASVFLRRDREIITETDAIRVPDRIEWIDVQFRTADVLALRSEGDPATGAAPAAEGPQREALDAPTVTAPEPFRTGFAGRPTSRYLVLAEMRERARRRAMHETLAAEARHLASWLPTAHPEAPPATANTIRDGIRAEYRAALAEMRWKSSD